MSKHGTGYDYVPDGAAVERAVAEGELKFAAAGLDHGHIYAQTQGLLNVGAECKWVWDPDEAKVKKFLERFPDVAVADSLERILGDSEIKLVANASVNSHRFGVGKKVLLSGKDFFCGQTSVYDALPAGGGSRIGCSHRAQVHALLR